MSVTKTAKAIGYALRERRERMLLPLRHVGEHTAIDFAIIGRAERGLHKLSLENATRLCDFYHMDIKTLVDKHTVRDKRGRII